MLLQATAARALLVASHSSGPARVVWPESTIRRIPMTWNVSAARRERTALQQPAMPAGPVPLDGLPIARTIQLAACVQLELTPCMAAQIARSANKV